MSVSQQLSLDNRGASTCSSDVKAVATKKCGVSGESSDISELLWELPIARVEKDFRHDIFMMISDRITESLSLPRSRELIKDALLDNSMLKNFLDHRQVSLIVSAMSEQEYAKGSTLCEEGAIGSHLFVIAEGFCNVSVASRMSEKVKQIGSGSAFGELAILYNCARTATVTAATDVRVWVLHRRTFQTIMTKTGKDRRKQYDRFLRR